MQEKSVYKIYRSNGRYWVNTIRSNKAPHIVINELIERYGQGESIVITKDRAEIYASPKPDIFLDKSIMNTYTREVYVSVEDCAINNDLSVVFLKKTFKTKNIYKHLKLIPKLH